MAKLTEEQALKERQKYFNAFYSTMVNIWCEQITLLGVMDTKALLFSVRGSSFKPSSDFKSAEFKWDFLEYGLWQNYGTGREIWRGNPGDIGMWPVRQPRKWMSIKFYASTMNIKEFMADNLGREFLGIFTNALNYDKMRHESNFYKTRGPANPLGDWVLF